jgi:chromosome segregation ATPase
VNDDTAARLATIRRDIKHAKSELSVRVADFAAARTKIEELKARISSLNAEQEKLQSTRRSWG